MSIVDQPKKFKMPGLGAICPVCGGPMHVGRTIKARDKIIRYRYCDQRCQGGKSVGIERFIDTVSNTRKKDSGQ